MYFVIERRAALSGDGPKGPQLMKQLGAEWKEMTDAQKEPYQTRSSMEQVLMFVFMFSFVFVFVFAFAFVFVFVFCCVAAFLCTIFHLQQFQQLALAT
jgi:hypothetical protein